MQYKPTHEFTIVTLGPTSLVRPFTTRGWEPALALIPHPLYDPPLGREGGRKLAVTEHEIFHVGRRLVRCE